MKLYPIKYETVIIKPYFKISFGCSYEQFCRVEQTLMSIAETLGISKLTELIDPIYDEDGDLEAIILYREEVENRLAEGILVYYNITAPDNLDIHLSMH